MEQKQQAQKEQFDGCKQERLFEVGDVVRVKNQRAQSKTDKWLLGSVIKIRGSRNYEVKVGSVTKLMHADHMFKTSENPVVITEVLPEVCDTTVTSSNPTRMCVNPENVINPTGSFGETKPENTIEVSSPKEKPSVISQPVRRSSRIKKPVERLNL